MPFQPGNNANPKGTKTEPKEFRLSTWITKELEKEYDVTTVAGHTEKMNAMKELATKVVEATKNANNMQELIQGLTFIADRTEGKPKQSTELSGAVTLEGLTIIKNADSSPE